MLKAATDAMVAAGKPLDDATKGLLNDVNGMAKTTFGANSEATKAINTITEIARPPSVGRSGNGGVTVTGPAGTSVSTGGTRGAGVSIQTPLGGVKF